MSQLEAVRRLPVSRRANPESSLHLAAGVHSRGWLIRRALVIADVVGLGIGFAVAQLMFGSAATGPGQLAQPVEFAIAALTLPFWIFAAKLYGLYDRDEERTDHSTIDEFVAVFHFVTIGAWLFFIGAWVTGLAQPNVSKLVAFWIVTTVLVTVGRAVARTLCRQHISYLQNTIVVGAGDVGQLVARKFLQHPEYGINLVGFVDNDPKECQRGLESLALLGSPADMPQLCELYDVERVVVAFSSEDARETLNLIRALRDLDVQIDLVPRLFDVVGPNATMHSVEGLPLVGLPPVRLTRSSRLIKRGTDIVGAAALLVLTAPVFLAIALCVRLSSAGPIFFRQRRLGIEMKEFTTLKFRTMHVGADEESHRAFIKQTMDRSTTTQPNGLFKLTRETELTWAGRFLRNTSLDELPQLLNVLRGEMSLVGPRPCIQYETEFFEPHHFERFLVPQGLTGLWQVTARARSTFAEALDMDVAYARSWSYQLDIKLLLKTPLQLFRLKGSA